MEFNDSDVSTRLEECPDEALVMIDADHFKRVSDVHGHPGGDAVLVALARACREQVRDVDVLARLGGEEFVLLLPATDRVGARATAERVRIAVEQLRVPCQGAGIRFTVSLGVAEFDAQDHGAEALAARADDRPVVTSESARGARGWASCKRPSCQTTCIGCWQ